MPTITIELPDTFTFKRAGFEKTVTLAEYPAHIIALAVQEGLKSTIGDAASAAASGHYETNRGDDTPDWATLSAADRKAWSVKHAMEIAEFGAALMDKRDDTLKAGDWTMRAPAVAGLSADESEVAEYMLTARMVEAPKGMKRGDKLKAVWDAFAGLPAETQAAIRAQIAASKGPGLRITLAPRGRGLGPRPSTQGMTQCMDLFCMRMVKSFLPFPKASES